MTDTVHMFTAQGKLNLSSTRQLERRKKNIYVSYILNQWHIYTSIQIYIQNSNIYTFCLFSYTMKTKVEEKKRTKNNNDKNEQQTKPRIVLCSKTTGRKECNVMDSL